MTEASAKPTMLYVGGSPRAFRCGDCGANVFTPEMRDDGQSAEVVAYRCNGCGTLYRGEP